ncbi:hypothetical protein P4233_03990 [Pseudomonas aeruginosa]|nr:hypothetical protein [Pseudomonas aeruginosa]
MLGTSQPSPAPELVERGTQHRFSTTEQTCRHDFYGVWWNDSGVTKTGRECRHCGLFVTDMTEAAAEQAGGDERVAFEEAASELGIYTCNFERYTEETAAHENRINARVEDPVRVGDYRSATLQDCWKVWQRAPPGQAGVDLQQACYRAPGPLRHRAGLNLLQWGRVMDKQKSLPRSRS